MIIDNNQQTCTIDNLEDEIYRLLFGEFTTLLDDVFNHPLSIDYFNVYLSLPIFGQRIFYYPITKQFDFDPPLLPKHQIGDEIYNETKEWLINFRLNNYIHTDIYIENLLVLLITSEFISKERSCIFSTVTDVRQFHQFLQSTSGIKYWNFFLDSIRLLQFRHSIRSHRIDISYLNFIYKYYSQQDEFRSITIDLNHHRMPDSTTTDTIWFQMAINAMQQLRIYWLPRYLSQVSSSSTRSKIKYPITESHSNENENISPTSLSHHSNTDSIISESKFIKYNLGNISYLDYNPQEYILIQSSEQHDTEEINESETHQVDKTSKIISEDISLPRSDRSIEDYATEDNIELFYRILISDSLAGSPFSEYMSQTIPKPDVIPYQSCIHFITDAEVLLSIPSGKFHEKILKQFISRYLAGTAIEELPDEVFDHIEEQRIDLMEELIRGDNTFLWKILLKTTKFLIPHFLNYIKFDRLRFLLQGRSLNTSVIIDDLRHRLPLVNFDTFPTDQQKTNINEPESISRTNCGQQPDDLFDLYMKNQYNTTEKLVNTDERCEFRPGERFPPLTDDELTQELNQLCAKFKRKDIETIFKKSFNIRKTLHPTNNTTILRDPLISNEELKMNSIERFTLDIMNSAREKFEIDNYISNLMNESLHFFQTNSSLHSIETDLNSSPLSPLFEEILLTDSSSIISRKLNTNNNALDSEIDNILPQRLIQTKILSSIGSYFINSPNITYKLPVKKDNFNPESIKFSQKDAMTEVNTLPFNKQIPSPKNHNQEQLLEFIQNHINNHQWPLEEYIGFKGHRAWRALKLAADISNLNSNFMLNYHHDLDWISTDNNLGSFGERTYLIRRNFHRRIEQQNRLINKRKN